MTLPVSEMISVEEARDRILALFNRLEPENVPLVDALGQVLSGDVVAPFDIPPLDNTAMDGYAVRSADTAGASEDAPKPRNTTLGAGLRTIAGSALAISSSRSCTMRGLVP